MQKWYLSIKILFLAFGYLFIFLLTLGQFEIFFKSSEVLFNVDLCDTVQTFIFSQLKIHSQALAGFLESSDNGCYMTKNNLCWTITATFYCFYLPGFLFGGRMFFVCLFVLVNINCLIWVRPLNSRSFTRIDHICLLFLRSLYKLSICDLTFKNSSI